MKRRIFQRYFSLPMIFMAGMLIMGLCVGSAHARDYKKDGKIYPGSACKPVSGSNTTNMAYGVTGSLANKSTGTIRVHCPIVRDNFKKDLGIEHIQVNFSDYHKRVKLTCKAEAWSNSGRLLSSKSATGSGQNSQGMLFLHGPRNVKGAAYFTLVCDVPGKVNGKSSAHRSRE